jgi:hypothetical protein
MQVLAQLELGAWFGGGAKLYGTGPVQSGLQVRGGYKLLMCTVSRSR